MDHLLGTSVDSAVPDCPLAKLDVDDTDDNTSDENASSDDHHQHNNASAKIPPNHSNCMTMHDGGRQGCRRSGGNSNSNSSSNSTSVTSAVAGGNLARSLEDLVATFDQRITRVLKNMEEGTEQLAPIKMRTQEEVMGESGVWWTLTGNYGQMPPLDFESSQIRRKQLAAMELGVPNNSDTSTSCVDSAISAISSSGYGNEDDGVVLGDNGDEEDEELLRHRLDFHQLVGMHSSELNYQNGGGGEQPPLTAEQVIEEIDEIYQNHDLIRSINATAANGCELGSDDLHLPSLSTITAGTTTASDSLYSSMRSPPYTATSSSLSASAMEASGGGRSGCSPQLEAVAAAMSSVSSGELGALSQSKLIALQTEMEQLIQLLNQDLVQELASRDELDYDKEVKNRFITLLVNLQDKRRKLLQTESKKGRRPFSSSSDEPPHTPTAADHQLLTTSIPYDALRIGCGGGGRAGRNSVHIPTLEALIKILQAIADNDKSVPALLTEYILTVVCPPPAAHTAATPTGAAITPTSSFPPPQRG